MTTADEEGEGRNVALVAPVVVAVAAAVTMFLSPCRILLLVVVVVGVVHLIDDVALITIHSESISACVPYCLRWRLVLCHCKKWVKRVGVAAQVPGCCFFIPFPPLPLIALFADWKMETRCSQPGQLARLFSLIPTHILHASCPRHSRCFSHQRSQNMMTVKHEQTGTPADFCQVVGRSFLHRTGLRIP